MLEPCATTINTNFNVCMTGKFRKQLFDSFFSVLFTSIHLSFAVACMYYVALAIAGEWGRAFGGVSPRIVAPHHRTRLTRRALYCCPFTSLIKGRKGNAEVEISIYWSKKPLHFCWLDLENHRGIKSTSTTTPGKFSPTSSSTPYLEVAHIPPKESSNRITRRGESASA